VKTVDLRSDTVTLPTPEMRKAMYEAELGDDVYGEDPTVRRLEEATAARLGKDAALFVASGTMGNLVSLLTHCQRGAEVIMGDESHTFFYEAGGVSVLGGVHVRTVPNLPDGMMDPSAVEEAIRSPNIHFPRTALICMENTHNRCGGTAIHPQDMAKVKRVAEAHGLPIHLDGARIFNAAVALGVDATDIAAQADTVQICFSKGLAAPVGSAIVGPADFIKEALRYRKIVGGGMRQAGVIAAAALVALDTMVDRLAEDHANARTLAELLADIKGLELDLPRVQTNIIKMEVTAPGVAVEKVIEGLRAEGVKINAIDSRHLRAVTHYGIVEDDVRNAGAAMSKVMKSLT